MRNSRCCFIFAAALTLFLLCTGEIWAQPAISVNPPGLGFPGVGINCRVTKILTINSVGTQTLTISNISLNNNYFNLFSFSGPTLPADVQPGNSIQISVTFSPKYDSIETANIRIDSTAPSSPTIVYLTGDGYGAQPCTSQQGYLEIAPTEINFGPVTIGNPGYHGVELTAWDAPVTLTEISIQSGFCPGYFRWYSLAEFFELPFTVPRYSGAGDSRAIFLRFDPATEGDCSGTLRIRTDSTITPTIQVPLQGGGYCDPVFYDVSCPHWAFHYITSIYYANITIGMPSPYGPIYLPDGNVTREEMAAFIIRSLVANGDLDAEPPADYCGTTNPFDDVPHDRWSCPFIKKLQELELASGYGDGSYGPTDLVTREQMAAFLTRALDEVPVDGYCGTSNPFTDVSYNRWGCKYVKKLVEMGITVGYGGGLYGPDDYVTRAQMAVFLKRAFLDMHWQQ